MTATVQDRQWLLAAIELSRACVPVPTAFSVGAIVVDADGWEIASGVSRAIDPHDHAEEVALRRAAIHHAAALESATIYSSLEPCGMRLSRPTSCSALIVAAGVRRVVFAWREPQLFTAGQGARNLRVAGIETIEIPDLADLVQGINQHLFVREVAP